MALGFTNAFQTGFQQSFVALGEAKISLFLALERKIFLLIPLIFILPHFFATSCSPCFWRNRSQTFWPPRPPRFCFSSASGKSQMKCENAEHLLLSLV